jgi:hypothetical protein
VTLQPAAKRIPVSPSEPRAQAVRDKRKPLPLTRHKP